MNREILVNRGATVVITEAAADQEKGMIQMESFVSTILNLGPNAAQRNVYNHVAGRVRKTMPRSRICS